LYREPEAREAARTAADGSPGGWDRLGSGRGARVRIASRRRDPDPALGAGHGTRDVLASARRATRSRDRRDVHAAPELAVVGCVVRDLQLAALRVRARRVRVRLLG